MHILLSSLSSILYLKSCFASVCLPVTQQLVKGEMRIAQQEQQVNPPVVSHPRLPLAILLICLSCLSVRDCTMSVCDFPFPSQQAVRLFSRQLSVVHFTRNISRRILCQITCFNKHPKKTCSFLVLL